jgi:hypothetical protein
MSEYYEKQTATVHGVPAPMSQPLVAGYAAESIVQMPAGQAGWPSVAERKAETLKFFVILLGLLGLVQFCSVPGVCCLVALCQIGCCSGSCWQVMRAAPCVKTCAILAAIFSLGQMAVVCSAANFASRFCGVVVLDANNATELRLYSEAAALLKDAVAEYTSTTGDSGTQLVTGSGGTINYDFAFPPAVCGYLDDPSSVAGEGVLFPHPLTGVAAQLEVYLIGLSGLTTLVAVAVAVLSCQTISLERRAPRRAPWHIPSRPAHPRTLPAVGPRVRLPDSQGNRFTRKCRG